jgi:bifunctional DNA-binding transcriptional regulator/antitoxin component of YhaV-PrlF toxin-antitoxin module
LFEVSLVLSATMRSTLISHDCQGSLALRSPKDAMLKLPVPLWDSGNDMVAKVVTVDMDEKGRVHIPSSLRRELKTRRFTLSVKGGRLLMEPVKSPSTVRGKYKGLLKVGIEELEEAQERFVTASKR